MARTKSTESKALAEASLPARKYEPSASERAILDKYHDRKNPVPELQVTHGDGVVKIGVDHPHIETGTVVLMDSLGTANEALFKGLVAQLSGLATAKLPEEIELKEIELNFSMSVVQAVKPRDEAEALLATQMAAMHHAVMQAAQRLTKVQTIEQQDSASRMLNQCARTFVSQLEGLKRHRSTSEQVVKVQHVNVHDGGQAIVSSTLQSGGGGGYGKIGHRPHAEGPPEPALLGKIEAIGPAMSSASGSGLASVPDARGTRRRANGQE